MYYKKYFFSYFQEDFQLSLWGGDAVFNKLDLRLNVIENLTHIPVTFKSGVIHELRIHVNYYIKIK